MPKAKDDALEKIKALKQTYKNAKESDKSKDEIKETSEDAKTAEGIIKEYKNLKAGLADKDITIRKLDKSLEDMQTLVISAFEQSEIELTNKKSRAIRFIRKSGKAIGALLGIQRTYSASNIEKIFDEVRAEKTADLVKGLVQKSPLSEWGTMYRNMGNYYTIKLSVEEYLEKNLSSYLKKRLEKFQDFFKNYAQIGIKQMGTNDANKFKDTYPITSALIRVTSALAGISVTDKETTTEFGKIFGNWSPEKQKYFSARGYMASFTYDLFNVIAMAMYICRSSTNKSFQKYIEKSHQDLFNEYKLLSYKQYLQRDVKNELAPSKNITHEDTTFPKYELLKEEAEIKERQANGKDKTAIEYQQKAEEYRQQSENEKAEAQKLRREASRLRVEADEMRKQAHANHKMAKK